MKKYTLLTIFFVFCFNFFSLQAQNFFGKAVYKYKYDFAINSSDTLMGDLYFNDMGESCYYYQNTATLTLGSSSTYKPTSFKDAKRTDSIIVYRNLISREYFYNKSSARLKNNLIKDTLKDIKWELLPATNNRKIGKFYCLAAKCRLHGRNYHIWYTPEIPVSSGPWKFFGLAGLIIEVNDEQNLIYFGLESIEISPKHKKMFDLENLRKNATSINAFLDEQKKQDESMISQGKTMGVTVTIKRQSRGLELEDN